MFSSRLSGSLAANRLSRLLEAKRTSGVQVLDLTESNPTQARFDYPEMEICGALAKPASLRYEPDPRGLFSARQTIADYYASRGERVTADAVHLTASTSEGYAYLLKLLANSGDEILVPQPSYPLFDFLAALESVHVARYPLQYDDELGWQIDLETLGTIITTKTKAIIIVNPNNPTGSFLKTNELAKLNQLCVDYDLALIVDEVFSDYSYGDHAQRVRSVVGNRDALTFVLSGLSKVCGLPQMKLGWIHVSGPDGIVAETRERLDFIADTYLSVSTSVQHAAAELLAVRTTMQNQIIARVLENENHLRRWCGELACSRALKVEGGWYAIVEIVGRFSEEDLCLALLEGDNVLVHPGYFFDFPTHGFLVVSLLTPSTIFAEGVSRIINLTNRMMDARE